MINVSFQRFYQTYFYGMNNCSDIRNRQLKDFKALDERAMQRLLQGSESIILPKGSVVFEEFEPLNKLYCIKRGAFKFSKIDRNGKEHVLRFLGEGEVMGKRSIISNCGAQVSAIALTEVELCCLEKEQIQKNLKTNTVFCQDFLDALVEDSNINEKDRMNFNPQKSIKSRLAHLLLFLAQKYGIEQSGKLKIKLKREDMAGVLGTSSEYIINLLRSFKNYGLIKTEKSNIFISSKKGLENIVC